MGYQVWHIHPEILGISLGLPGGVAAEELGVRQHMLQSAVVGYAEG